MKKEQIVRISTIYIIVVLLLVHSSFPFSTKNIVHAISMDNILRGNKLEHIDSNIYIEEPKVNSLEEPESGEETADVTVPSNEIGPDNLNIVIESPYEEELFNNKIVSISGKVFYPIPVESVLEQKSVLESEGAPETEGTQGLESTQESDSIPIQEIVPNPDIVSVPESVPTESKTESENIIESDVVPQSENTELDSTDETENPPEQGSISEAEIVTVSEEIVIEIYKTDEELPLGEVSVKLEEVKTDVEWVFEYEFSDGNHTIYAIVKDDLGNSAVSEEVSFSIDSLRPFVWINNHPYDTDIVEEEIATYANPVEEDEYSLENENYIVNDDSKVFENITQNEDAQKISCPPATPNMTRVCLDSSIVIVVEDNNPLYEENGEIIENVKTANRPIRLYKSSEGEDIPTINATVNFDRVTINDGMTEPEKLSEKENRLVKITLTFTEENPLDPFTTYYVSVGDVKDKAGNLIHARLWKFTTGDKFGEVAFDERDPHGNYSNNVNFCANCHSTHAAKEEKLVGGGTHLPSREVYYCMSCHDGTVAPAEALEGSEVLKDPEIPIAPKATNILEKQYKHGYVVNVDGIKFEHELENRSCTSCHDPHLTWNEDNPNLLKSRYVYKNHPEVEGYTEDFDSQKVLCETCHYNGSEIADGYTVKNAKEVTYEVFQYSTEVGGADSYSLCLRCHSNLNPNPEFTISDINTYYSDENSKHKFIETFEGVPSNGFMPCAECHDTHGTSNSMLLKGRLGHENQGIFEVGEITEWTPLLEKKFCLTCHNNVTLIFGKQAKFDETVHETVPNYEEKTCSSCHGGTSGSFIEAAHAPKPGIIPE